MVGPFPPKIVAMRTRSSDLAWYSSAVVAWTVQVEVPWVHIQITGLEPEGKFVVAARKLERFEKDRFDYVGMVKNSFSSDEKDLKK